MTVHPGKWRANFHTTVSVTTTVTVTEEDLKRIAEQIGVEVSELEKSDLDEFVTSRGLDVAPTNVCAHCTGMFSDTFSFSVDGELESDEDEPISYAG